MTTYAVRRVLTALLLVAAAEVIYRYRLAHGS